MSSWHEGITCVGRFNTVQGFWSIYSHILRPNDIRPSMDLMLFREGIQPMWEDAHNEAGGKISFQVKKGVVSYVWEALILALIGETLPDTDEVCGLILNIRHQHDGINVWNRKSDTPESVARIRAAVRALVHLPESISIDYAPHRKPKPEEGDLPAPEPEAAPAQPPMNPTMAAIFASAGAPKPAPTSGGAYTAPGTRQGGGGGSSSGAGPSSGGGAGRSMGTGGMGAATSASSSSSSSGGGVRGFPGPAPSTGGTRPAIARGPTSAPYVAKGRVRPAFALLGEDEDEEQPERPVEDDGWQTVARR